MPRDPNCVFCKIVANELPAAVVYEDSDALAFLDVGPLADGHLLLIPRAHHPQLVDLPVDLIAALARAVPKLSRALLDVTRADGFNLLINNGTVAGQVVEHVHFHLIPRSQNDELGYRWNAGTYATGRAEQLAESYKTSLSSNSA